MQLFSVESSDLHVKLSGMEFSTGVEFITVKLEQSSKNVFKDKKKTLTNISSYEVMQIVMQIFVEIVRVATRGAIESIKV